MSQISKSLANKPHMPAPATAAAAVNKSPSPKRVRDLDLDDRINLLTDQESTENLAGSNLKSAVDQIKKHSSVEEIGTDQRIEFDSLLDLLVVDKSLQDALNRVRKTYCLHQLDFHSLMFNSRSQELLKDSFRLNQNVQLDQL